MSSEGLPADVARVRPFVRVRPLVDQQIVTLGELPVAILAYELLLRPSGSASNFRGYRSPTWTPQISKLVPGVVVDGGVPQPLVHEDVVTGISDAGVHHGVGLVRRLDVLWTIPAFARVAG